MLILLDILAYFKSFPLRFGILSIHFLKQHFPPNRHANVQHSFIIAACFLHMDNCLGEEGSAGAVCTCWPAALDQGYLCPGSSQSWEVTHLQHLSFMGDISGKASWAAQQGTGGLSPLKPLGGTDISLLLITACSSGINFAVYVIIYSLFLLLIQHDFAYL